MKKIIAFLVLALVIGGGVYIYFNYVRTGALRGAIEIATPTKKDIKNFLPQGADLYYPLKIPSGFRVGVFADLGSGKPRVLALDTNGVLFASITNEGKVVAMPDKNNDGKADEIISVLTDLNRPHGILFYQGYLYVAETDKVTRYPYDKSSLKTSLGQELFSLPGGGGHFTRTIKVIDNKLYTSIGSSCNVCAEKDEKRASIWVSEPDGSNLRLFAKGLRNTVFFTADSQNRIWGNDMGRDNLGDNLPPDELNIISEEDYGWPYCYGQKIRDKDFRSGQAVNYCAETASAAFEYPAHVAPLGITFIDSELFSPGDQGSILVAFHGSWNSSVPVGYKIVKLSLLGGSVTRMEDFISGFIQDSKVLGRPVDLIFDADGYLYVSDDKAGLVYVVSRN
ncbi:PQQ-dependent sugar dehydrogenase [Candidatus Woesebacteria bacterium]|nr:PQQ-dependent sugar dehydrogenase [Candidatus Woesebacteria bacterium]